MMVYGSTVALSPSCVCDGDVRVVAVAWFAVVTSLGIRENRHLIWHQRGLQFQGVEGCPKVVQLVGAHKVEDVYTPGDDPVVWPL